MERDDLIMDHQYAVSANHDEAHGREIRKKIWFVTFLLSAITAVEVLVGVFFPKDTMGEGAWTAIKLGYIILTLVKAGYIVMVFMHLGDARKNFKWMLLGPYVLFISYFMFQILTEGYYVGTVVNP